MIKVIDFKRACYAVKPTEYWFKADFNMNIYRGCNHGCIYCDSRSDCYQIENFDQVRLKGDIGPRLSLELTAKRKKGIISLGAMSDCYNSYEGKLGATRAVLKVIRDTGFGVVLYTKSDLVVRDIDILKAIPNCLVVLTITCAQDEMARIIEPQAPSSSRRFKALEQLTQAGIKTGVAMVPLVPFVNDTIANIEGIVTRTKQAGGLFVYPMFGMTCRSGQKEYFYGQIERHYPGMARRYQDQFYNSYNCISPRAGKLHSYFVRRCRELGLVHEMREINDLYYPRTNEQLSLF